MKLWENYEEIKKKIGKNYMKHRKNSKLRKNEKNMKKIRKIRKNK
jgi:hypothetical protein